MPGKTDTSSSPEQGATQATAAATFTYSSRSAVFEDADGDPLCVVSWELLERVVDWAMSRGFGQTAPTLTITDIAAQLRPLLPEGWRVLRVAATSSIDLVVGEQAARIDATVGPTKDIVCEIYGDGVTAEHAVSDLSRRARNLHGGQR